MRPLPLILLLIALAASPGALTAQDLDAVEEALQAGREEEAFATLQRLAGLAHADAQYRLAQFYASGTGTERNMEEAALWYRKAAEQDHPGAQFALGILYANGDGVEQDDDQAVDWYLEAARQGHVDAQYNLGYMYAHGRGVEADSERARIWYRMAADEGHPLAQINLGTLYATGDGVERDDAQAAAWYRRAAEQGHAAAQFSLGFLYAYGRGVERDPVAALQWYRRAAAQGHAQAQVRLRLLEDRLAARAVHLTVDRANLRAGPSTDARVIATIEPGREIYWLDPTGEWIEVHVLGDDAGRGWIHRRLLDGVPENVVSAEREPPEAVALPAAGAAGRPAVPEALAADGSRLPDGDGTATDAAGSEEDRPPKAAVSARVGQAREALRAGIQERNELLTRLSSITDQTVALTARIQAMEAQRRALREELAKRTRGLPPEPEVSLGAERSASTGDEAGSDDTPGAGDGRPSLREGFLAMLEGIDNRLARLENRLDTLEEGQNRLQQQWLDSRKELLEYRAEVEARLVTQQVKAVESQAAEVKARLELNKLREQVKQSESRNAQLQARVDSRDDDSEQLLQRVIALEEERDSLLEGLAGAQERLEALRTRLEAEAQAVTR